MESKTQTNWPSSYQTFKQALVLMGRHAWPVFLLLLVHLTWILFLIAVILLTSGLDADGQLVINYWPGAIILLATLFYTVMFFVVTVRLTGESMIASFRSLFDARTWELFFPALAVLLLTLLLVLGGLIFFIIPGIILLTYFAFSSFFLVLGGFGIKESFLQSYQHAKGMGWHIFKRLLFLFFLIAVSRLFALVPGSGQGVSFFLSVFLGVVSIFYLGVTYFQIVSVQALKNTALKMSAGAKVMTVFLAVFILLFFWVVTSVADFVASIYPYPFGSISLF